MVFQNDFLQKILCVLFFVQIIICEGHLTFEKQAIGEEGGHKQFLSEEKRSTSADGNELNWRNTKNSTLTFAVDDQDNIIAMTQRQGPSVWYYEGTTGKQIWNINIPNVLPYYYCSNYPVQTNGDQIAVLVSNCGNQGYDCMYNCKNNVFALDIQNGSILWNYTSFETSYAKPIVDSEGVYIPVAAVTFNSSTNISVIKISLKDGSIVWSSLLPLKGRYLVGSALSPLGIVFYLSNSDRFLYGYDALTGDMKYQLPLWGTPSYSTPIFTSDGTMFLTCVAYLICYNPDLSLRYWTTNRTISASELTFDEKRNQVYAGYLGYTPVKYYELWQAYDIVTGRQNWNMTYYMDWQYVGDYPVHAPAVRESDGLLVFMEDFTFVGRAWDTRRVVFNITASFTYPTQLSKPVIRKDGSAFYVLKGGYNWAEIWSVPLPEPEMQSDTQVQSTRQTSVTSFPQQCGTYCNSYADCDGFLCSKCQNNLCVQPPETTSNSTCSYRGDCDERTYTCHSGKCIWLHPGCAQICDYWATCGGGCRTCSASRCQSP